MLFCYSCTCSRRVDRPSVTLFEKTDFPSPKNNSESLIVNIYFSGSVLILSSIHSFKNTYDKTKFNIK